MNATVADIEAAPAAPTDPPAVDTRGVLSSVYNVARAAARWPREHAGTLLFASVCVALLLCGVFVAQWHFSYKGWVTLSAVLLCFVALVEGIAPTEYVLLVLVVVLMLVRPHDAILSPAQAFAGFANEAVISVAALFAVAAALHETRALEHLLRRLLGTPRHVGLALARLVPLVTLLSAFTNNTPLVMLMVPVVQNWARRSALPVSYLLLPLSYATILGGTCTLIGTSTNLFVNSLLKQSFPAADALNLFEIAAVGVPNAVLGALYIVLLARWVLPAQRTGVGDHFAAHTREYVVAACVPRDSRAAGSSIAGAGLRSLPRLYLFEVQRGDQEVFPAPDGEFRLCADDVLLFTGDVSSICDLWTRPAGILPLTHDLPVPLAAEQDAATVNTRRRLYEAVLAPQAALIGERVRDARFRERYNAAIVAVHRAGERLPGRIGDVLLRGGDTVLLVSDKHFATRFGTDLNSFLLACPVHGAAAYLPRPFQQSRAIASLLIVALMVAATAANLLPLIVAALLALGALLALRCISVEQAWRALRRDVLLIMALSIALGEALRTSGVADTIAQSVLRAAPHLGRLGIVALLYALTCLMTALLSNTACVSLLWPIAVRVIDAGFLTRKAAAYTLMLAASADFSTPFGYQTNTIVYAIGGYRFADFVRFGVPLQMLCAGGAIPLIWLLWNRV